MLLRSLCIAAALALAGCGAPTSEHDVTAAYAEVRLEGVMQPLLRPGGESTGFGLRLDDGRLIEIDLARHALVASYRQGARVAVSGAFERREGVEMRARSVFVVTSLRLAG